MRHTTVYDQVFPGAVFGSLTVIRYDDNETQRWMLEHPKAHGKRMLYLCQCECGQIRYASPHDLVSGRTTTCGSSQCRRKPHYGKRLNLEGMRINNLTAICVDENRMREARQYTMPSGQKNNRVFWLCFCHRCGGAITVDASRLKRGLVHDCGCGRNQRISQAVLNNLSGQQFGYLTVIERDTTQYTNTYPATRWWCNCDICHSTVSMTSEQLLRSGRDRCQNCSTSSIGEQKILDLLRDHQISFVHDKPYPLCDYKGGVYGNGKLRFDFRITDNSECDYFIEFDGEQHFREAIFSNDDIGKETERLNDLQRRDAFKNEWCVARSIPIIRIPYSIINSITIDDLIPETSEYVIRSLDDARHYIEHFTPKRALKQRNDSLILKEDLIESLVNERGYTKKAANQVIDDVCNMITSLLETGEPVMLRGFGKFEVKTVPARESVMPNTLERYTIPEHNEVKFTAGKTLKRRIRGDSDED